MAGSHQRNDRARSETRQEPDGAMPADRSARIATIERRLADGYWRIDAAQGSGEDTGVWEDYWITLLHSYEALCDGVDLAA